MSDTVPVQVDLVACEMVRGRGALLALLTAEVVIADVALRIQGIQVRRDRDGSLVLRPPEFRAGDGRWWSAIVLPEEIGLALLDEFEAVAGEFGHV